MSRICQEDNRKKLINNWFNFRDCALDHAGLHDQTEKHEQRLDMRAGCLYIVQQMTKTTRKGCVMKSLLASLLLLNAAAFGASQVRVAHLSPDAPAVDIHVDGSAVLTAVPYAVFSPYLELPAGMHQLDVFVSGTTTDPVISANLEFAEGASTTVAATGLLANGSFGPVVFEDMRESDPEMHWVRFIHSAGDAPPVDITLPDGTVVFGNVAFNQATDFLALEPGDYSLEVRVAGTDTIVKQFAPVMLEASTTLSVFAVGSLVEGSLGALAALDNPGDGSTVLPLAELGASVRVAHLSPDAPAVDVYVDGAMALEAVPYPAFSSYLDLPAGEHHLEVFVSGTMENAVIDASLPFAAGSATTIAATGLLADGSFGPIVLEDSRDANHDEAWVRFIHTAADAPAVDITLDDGTVLFGDIAFNESASWLPVAPGSVGLQVRLAGTETVVLDFQAIELGGMSNYSVFATGTLADGSLGAWATVDAPGDGSAAIQLEQENSIDDSDLLPADFGLLGVHPNPFNPAAQIEFELSASGLTNLAVYNLAGQQVASLINEEMPAGRHSAVWNAAALPSGLYLARLDQNGAVSVERMTLLK